MSTSSIAAIGHRTQDGSRRVRLLAVAFAALAGVGVWVLADVFGVDVRQPAFGVAQQSQVLGAPFVAVVSALAALAGWGLLAVFERLAASHRRVWTVIATLALLLSLGAPLSGHGVTASSRVTLVAMHLAVGAVVITLLRRSSQPRRDASGLSESASGLPRSTHHPG